MEEGGWFIYGHEEAEKEQEAFGRLGFHFRVKITEHASPSSFREVGSIC